MGGKLRSQITEPICNWVSLQARLNNQYEAWGYKKIKKKRMKMI